MCVGDECCLCECKFMVWVLCVSWLCVWVGDVLYVSVRSCYVCHGCVSVGDVYMVVCMWVVCMWVVYVVCVKLNKYGCYVCHSCVYVCVGGVLYVSVRSWSGCYMCNAWLCVCDVYVVCVSGMDVTGMGIMCVTIVCVGGMVCCVSSWYGCYLCQGCVWVVCV